MEFDYTSTSTSRQPAHPASIPLSLKELNRRATHFDYNPLIPLRYWLRTADNLRKESNIYLSEGDDQQAYILLLRWVELVLQYLTEHPERIHGENAINLARARRRLPEAFGTLEQLKPRLEADYQAYRASRRLNTAHRLPSTSSSSSSSPRRNDASSLPPESHQDNGDMESHLLALELARHEYEKRERKKRKQRERDAREYGRDVPLDSSGTEIHRISTSPVQYIYATPPRETDDERQAREALEDENDMMETIKALSMGTDPAKLSHERRPYLPRVSYDRDPPSAYDFGGFPEYHEQPREEPSVGRWTGSYPTVPKLQYSPNVFSPSIPPPALPPLPPKLSTIPALPPKLPTAPALPPKVAERQPPLPPAPPATRPEKQFSMPATLENGTPLRTMFLPASLRDTFLHIAQPNTSSNLETCGILCGTLIQNALFVSRLVIPEQEATSDTCVTKDEEGLFEYCDREDLMMLGWIHTHPTQTCFMSSVDLHTHAGYQLMMCESIAIVCAPSQNPSWGVFRLTDPPGLQVIVNCRQRGLFHPHEADSVYTDAMRPGHVCIIEEMGFDVVDLRK